eukprot:TRINITY_DN11252_c0_g1_i3.p2 TRINITY_DN11252_c0_g1~~TRINITY_DN11252_c0_g1_i3.p2  ORF type:complete len:126 (+),score=23.80 TRINITY_DN11252_c0_g1_i3:123-500(+)
MLNSMNSDSSLPRLDSSGGESRLQRSASSNVSKLPSIERRGSTVPEPFMVSKRRPSMREEQFQREAVRTRRQRQQMDEIWQMELEMKRQLERAKQMKKLKEQKEQQRRASEAFEESRRSQVVLLR